MPGTADSARNDCERTGSGEECGGQDSGESGILHTYLDGNGAVLRLGEMEQSAHCISEEVAGGVMAEHDSEDEEEE